MRSSGNSRALCLARVRAARYWTAPLDHVPEAGGLRPLRLDIPLALLHMSAKFKPDRDK